MLDIAGKVLFIVGMASWILSNFYSIVKNRAEIKTINRKFKVYENIINGSNTPKS